ncbi:MAG: hypothetical protein ISS15_09660 [Alphaproteobacteria bacterium]|nr:hypothetical protein [Alphaproteobacteria bacterium]MBL6938730.1 hypothetical protein [Alphaproteobacteria bacterium]MBL7097913.1 hypothetical protein [Alphaproteobacteria bacterium]
MPAYEICYLEEDGALACAFSVQFDNEMRAKILAHAMKPTDCHRMEVWRGRELVYARPEIDEAFDRIALLAHRRWHMPAPALG